MNNILDAFTTATLGLKDVRVKNNLSVESIESVMEQFNEEMEELKSIDNALASSSFSRYGIIITIILTLNMLLTQLLTILVF
jgi:hypothetical protein